MQPFYRQLHVGATGCVHLIIMGAFAEGDVE